MRKLLLLLTMLVSLSGLISRAAETVTTWTFDKTPVASGTVELNKANAAQYLPDGWVYLANDGDYLIDADNGEGAQPAFAGSVNTEWWVEEENVVALPVKAGKLSFNLKIYPSHGMLELVLYKVNKAGDTYSVGDELKSDLLNATTISKDAYTWVDYDIEEDGYVGFAMANKGLLLSVKNTYEGGEDVGQEPGGMVSDSWTFDKKAVTGDTYIKKADYTEYLPDGWAFNGGDWDYRISLDEGTQVLKGANSTYVSSSKLIIFPVKAGTLSFDVKSAANGSLVIALYKMNPNGNGGYTAGDQFYNRTLSSPDVSATEYNWVDVEIEDDCYVGLYFGNQGLCREIRNTTAATSAEQTDCWTFDKKAVTGDTYIKKADYTEYLPDGWAFNGGDWDYRISLDEGAQMLKGANSTYVSSSKLIIFPVKAGTLSFDVKAAANGSLVIALYKMNPNGNGGYTAGDQFYNRTLSSPDVSATEYNWVDVEIEDDCYVGLYFGNQGLCREIRNTYAGEVVGSNSVSGIVKDEDGNVVEGATVKIGSESTETAADGSWTIENIADGNLTVRVSKDGYSVGSTDITVAGADLDGVEVTLNWIVSSIKGHLMDEIDYAIVYGKLTFSDSEGNVYGTAETTAEMPDYEVKFKGVVPASFKVDIEPKYYKPTQYTWSPSVGQEYTRNFIVSRLALSVNVKPTDTNGNPVTGATVALVEKDNTDATVALGESGAGTYTATRFYAHVAADKKYIVTVEHPDYEPYTSDEVVFDGEGKTIEPVLASLAPTVFKGVVKSGLDDSPLADATVSLRLPDTPTALVTVVTDPEGAYTLTLEGALEAAYVLSVSADYFEPEIIDITEPERGKEYINDVVLKAVMLSFTARVENEAGDIIEGATVNFNGSDLEAEDGLFIGEAMAYGSYWTEYAVKVSAPGYESQEETVIFGGMPLEKVYTLKEVKYTFTAIVVDESNEPIEGATATITDGENTWTLTEDGPAMYSISFTANESAGKTYTVTVSKEGFETSAPYTFSFEGEDHAKAFYMEEAVEKTLTFTAIVVDESIEPIEGAIATITDGENTWTLTEDAPAMYSISFPASEADGKTFTVIVSKEGFKTSDAYTFTFEGEDHSKAFYLELDESGIANIGAAADGTLRVYDINGRRIDVESVKELPAGFYIINGVKTAIR